MSTLIISEKTQAADAIAAALGFKKSRGVYEGTFEGKSAVMVATNGHLVELQNPDEVVPDLTWNTSPRDMLPIPREFPMKIRDDSPRRRAGSQPKDRVALIARLIKGCSRVIIATDSDREGEAIGWHLLGYLKYKGQVQRAWLASGLDKKSLQGEFSTLREPDVTKSWYRASEARARSDWAFMILVRAYTYFARRGAYGPMLGQGRGRESVMSAGRVQTTAEAMIVERERDIRNFVSVDHFRVAGDFALQGGGLTAEYRPVVTDEIMGSSPPGVVWDPRPPRQDGTAVPDHPLFVDKRAVSDFKDRLMGVKDRAVVTGYRTRDRMENPPKTFALASAQAEIGRALKIPANLVKTILEDLYEQGWTSYARTNKSELPMNFYESSERNAVLNSIKQLSPLADAAAQVQDIHNGKNPNIKAFVPKIFDKKDLNHWGIIPTEQSMTQSAFENLGPRKADKGRAKHTREQMQQAYLIVARQYIQALYPPARWAVQDMELSAPTTGLLGERSARFTVRGERLIDPGWRAAFGVGLEKDTSLPVSAPKDAATIKSVSIASAKTKPPQRYTDVTLNLAMENIAREIKDPHHRKLLRESEGIGRPASRDDAIDTIIARGYIESRRSAYYATPKGEAHYDHVEPWIRTPVTTALWEDKLVALTKERDDKKAIALRDEFVSGQIDLIEKLIRDISDRFESKIGAPETSSGPSKVTPKMRSSIKSIAARKGVAVPRGTLSDPDKAKAFLDEHLGSRASGGAPSEAALRFAESLVAHLPRGVSPPKDLKTDRQVCSDFINMAKQYQPPSPKARSFAEKLLREMPEKERPDDSFLGSASAVSEFIDARLGKKPDRPSVGR